MNPPEMTPLALEETARRLADACNALTSIQEANRADGVLNEHMVHSEQAAENLVKRLGEELSYLKANTRNIDDGTCDDRTPENTMNVMSILVKKTRIPSA